MDQDECIDLYDGIPALISLEELSSSKVWSGIEKVRAKDNKNPCRPLSASNIQSSSLRGTKGRVRLPLILSDYSSYLDCDEIPWGIERYMGCTPSTYNVHRGRTEPEDPFRVAFPQSQRDLFDLEIRNMGMIKGPTFMSKVGSVLKPDLIKKPKTESCRDHSEGRELKRDDDIADAALRKSNYAQLPMNARSLDLNRYDENFKMDNNNDNPKQKYCYVTSPEIRVQDHSTTGDQWRHCQHHHSLISPLTIGKKNYRVSRL